MLIAVSGWDAGFQKVRFTELLRHELGYSLSRAKSATDAVLEDQSLELEVAEEKSARLLSLLQEIGVKETHVTSSQHLAPGRENVSTHPLN